LSYLVVVAPLRPEMRGRARELLDEGPPFDLAETVFVRHSAHLSQNEVVFVFESDGPPPTLALAGEDVRLWRAASAWRECLAAAPRVARTVFAWEAGDSLGGITFGPTPGPGDSDGGDVYPP
jgi:hypothetical protein